jgi:hypothetical protein
MTGVMFRSRTVTGARHFTHYYAAVWKPYLISFMGLLGPDRGGSVIAVIAVTDRPCGMPNRSLPPHEGRPHAHLSYLEHT